MADLFTTMNALGRLPVQQPRSGLGLLGTMPPRIRVRNMVDTADDRCRCPSRLEHWSNYGGGKLPTSCAVVGCFKPATCGGHVHLGTLVPVALIVPLCDEHNGQQGEELVIDARVPRVAASVALTCGKSLP